MTQQSQKTWLIAGGASGIGLGIVQEIYSNTNDIVIFSSRSQKKIENCLQLLTGNESPNPRLHGVCVNLNISRDIKSTLADILKRWSRIDVLVSTIGSGKRLEPDPASEDALRAEFETNFFGPCELIKIFHANAERATIIAISSIAALESLGAPWGYSASKSALNSYLKEFSRLAYRERHNRINIISPGNICFPGGAWEQKTKEDPLGIKQMLELQVPAGRFGDVDEIVRAVRFLVDNEFSIGANLIVDGGQTRGLR